VNINKKLREVSEHLQRKYRFSHSPVQFSAKQSNLDLSVHTGTHSPHHTLTSFQTPVVLLRCSFQLNKIP